MTHAASTADDSWRLTHLGRLLGHAARRFDERVAARLEALAWWDWTHEELRLALPDFRALSAEAFLEKWKGHDRITAAVAPRETSEPAMSTSQGPW